MSAMYKGSEFRVKNDVQKLQDSVVVLMDYAKKVKAASTMAEHLPPADLARRQAARREVVRRKQLFFGSVFNAGE